MADGAVSDQTNTGSAASGSLFSGQRRDPKRIRPFLDLLATVWEHPRYSDERFGQFIKNLSRDERGQFEDIWNWENSDFRERLERLWQEAMSND